VDATSKTIEENGKTLDINTAAGRANQRSLIDQSDAAIKMAEGQLQAGTSADVVTANLTAQREAMLLQLDAMTGNRAESERLAASMGLIPKEVITEVSTNGVEKTKTDIETIPATKDATVNVTETGTAETQARIEGVHGKDVEIDVQDFDSIQHTQQRIDGLKGKDVGIDVQDFDSIQHTQQRIDGLKGKDVDISVRIANLYDIQRTLDNLTAARSVDLTINERKGTSQAP
jgi:hypothetical protein